MRAGNLILVELTDLPGINIGDSMGNSFAQVASVNVPSSTYNVQVYYAIASSNGRDTITVSGLGNFPEIVAHEMSGAQFTGHFSTGSGISGNPTVASYMPGRHAFVLAIVACANGGTLCDDASVTAGAGYALIGQYPAPLLADEGAILGHATTSAFTLGSQQNWAEISLSFT